MTTRSSRLRSIFRSKTRKSHQNRSNRRRLFAEGLEDRRLLAVVSGIDAITTNPSIGPNYNDDAALTSAEAGGNAYGNIITPTSVTATVGSGYFFAQNGTDPGSVANALMTPNVTDLVWNVGANSTFEFGRSLEGGAFLIFDRGAFEPIEAVPLDANGNVIPGDVATYGALMPTLGTHFAAPSNSGRPLGGIAIEFDNMADVYGIKLTTAGFSGSADAKVFAATPPPGPATVSISGASVREGNPGDSNQLVFDVTLSEAVAADVSVDYTTQNGTALAGSDYVATSGTVTIPAGQTTAQIKVNVNADSTIEPDETVEVLLSNVQTTASNGVFLDVETGTFARTQQQTNGYVHGWGQQDVKLADLDGDGDLDGVMVAGGQTGSIGTTSIMINDGNGNFTQNAIADPNASTTASVPALARVDTGDVDGDGDIDVFVTHGPNATLFNLPATLYLNNGDGTFSASVTVARTNGQNHSADVSLGDLDGDGDLDAYINGYSALPAFVFFNDGNGNFTDSGQSLASGNRTDAAELGDVDGDGDLDVVLAGGRGIAAPSEVWLNDGNGNFTDSGQRLGSAIYMDVSLGDVDNDGDLDAFFTNLDAGDEVWLNNGSGVFTDSGQRVGSALPGRGRSLDLGDVDGDGDLDAFAITVNTGNRIYLNQGGNQGGTIGEFVEQPRFGFDLRGVALGDANGDGHIDAFGSHNGGWEVWQNQEVAVPGVGTILDDDANADPNLTVNSATVTVNEGDLATNGGSVTDPDGNTVSLSATSGSVTNNNDGTWSWSLATNDGPADGTGVTISGDDGNGGLDDVSFTLVVNNVVPDASVSGPASALIGELVTITLGAADASSADQVAGFDFDIDWDGNGTIDQSVNGADGTTVDHTFTAGGATTVIVTATDKDSGESDPVSFQINVIQPVDVDVKPGNAQNKVNAKSQGLVTVALYTTNDFDAANVIGSSVQLAGVGADHFALEDVDNDGDLDLVLHFAVQDLLDALDLDLDSGDEESVDVSLTGSTTGGVDILGTDTINFFFPGKGKGKK